MLERQVRIVNSLGLHARAAAKLVRLAVEFESEITLFRSDTGRRADAKSILEILLLAVPTDSRLTIQIEGSDEQSALAAVVDIFDNGFGEN